ncbi:sugar ABC transporter substrate-binding protein [Luteimicrobium album]|uniref:Sugar ABC transporter substrate-binding protein n=1 Tax=Luteimicrobium album TaxID=1054550 RepID=A0ABQ6I026_9MICO|nr:ABC transporter substrate-binding protein [Luteimicrobium album]GMA24051.1 sugar ABC transporter substrate-binding protein [Luteimicrobium album]
MTTRRILAAGVTAAAVALTLTACVGGGGGASGGDDTKAATDAFQGDVKGTITVLTNRTDLVKTTLADYAKQFEAKYPGTTVKFEAITNYEDDVTIRLNSHNYGDVLLVPNKVTKDQLPQFFEPLGTVDELGKTYRFINAQAYNDNVYALSTFGTAQGYVLNAKVWKDAGITAPPKTTDELLQDLQAIKDKTKATPYYTNYADGWPLSNWQNNAGAINGPDATKIRDADDSPWDSGKEQYQIDGLLYDIVHQKLSEADPTTTNWEESKNLLGTGKIAMMQLGSWAAPQMQDAAVKSGASKDDIAFWPMPFQKDGKFQSIIGSDYTVGISKYSKNKATAKAWLDWFENESGFAQLNGGIPANKDGAMPDILKPFQDFGVDLVELNPAPKGQETLDTDIQNASQIDLQGPNYRKQMIDVARGAAKGDKDSFFADLNKRWAAARAQVATQ